MRRWGSFVALGLFIGVLTLTQLPDARGASADNRWALIVGITDYVAPTHDTYGGAGDVLRFRQMLLEQGWRDDHIVISVDRGATRQNIIDGMNWLISKSNPNSFTIFHYSGHVKQKGIGNEFLWPADNRLISDHEFAGYMRQLQGSSWVDIAGCEASGFDEGIASPNRLFTGSSQIDEKSYEDPSVGHSVWTNLVVNNALRTSRGMTIQSAVAWAAERAPEFTAAQQPHGPQHPYITGATGKQWTLSSVPGTPPPPPRAPAAPATPPKQCTLVEKLLGCK